MDSGPSNSPFALAEPLAPARLLALSAEADAGWGAVGVDGSADGAELRSEVINSIHALGE